MVCSLSSTRMSSDDRLIKLDTGTLWVSEKTLARPYDFISACPEIRSVFKYLAVDVLFKGKIRDISSIVIPRGRSFKISRIRATSFSIGITIQAPAQISGIKLYRLTLIVGIITII